MTDDIQWDAEEAEAQAREDASMERSPDPRAARELEQRMSEISEDCWCAGWLDGVEESLWTAIARQPLEPEPYGMGEVSLDDLRDLRRLCAAADGWWRYREFVPIADWLAAHPDCGVDVETARSWAGVVRPQKIKSKTTA